MPPGSGTSRTCHCGVVGGLFGLGGPENARRKPSHTPRRVVGLAKRATPRLVITNPPKLKRSAPTKPQGALCSASPRPKPVPVAPVDIATKIRMAIRKRPGGGLIGIRSSRLTSLLAHIAGDAHLGIPARSSMGTARPLRITLSHCYRSGGLRTGVISTGIYRMASRRSSQRVVSIQERGRLMHPTSHPVGWRQQ